MYFFSCAIIKDSCSIYLRRPQKHRLEIMGRCKYSTQAGQGDCSTRLVVLLRHGAAHLIFMCVCVRVCSFFLF